MDQNVHRMLVGGPRDNQIVYVHKGMPPFQVSMFSPIPQLMTWNDIVEADVKATVKTGWYYVDEFYWGYNHERFYRWQEMGRIAAAKIYMRRMGASLYDIYNKVEWDSWGG